MDAKTREFEIRQKLKDDFPCYAEKCLKIRTKEGQILPLKLNKSQQHIHDQLEAQLEQTGRVRAIILKGRQQGSSTYVEGRFMWKTTHRTGCYSYILTHEDEASQNIFDMAKRYFEHLPAFVKPTVNRDNAKELKFPNLDSGYKVGTAGNKTTGRSQTNQLFHGSEVAFWKNAEEHAKGVLQTVPDMDGTEVILESTANGMGNYYHQQWKMAEAGLSDYLAIFVPWYWQDEYRKTPPKDFSLTEDEEVLKDRYEWDDAQVFWRRQKIRDLSAGGIDGERAFKQEYPNNAAEAFQITGDDGLIKPDVVLAARGRSVSGNGPVIVGVDPSRGGDRFAVIRRQGRKAYKVENYTGAQVDKLGKAVSICKKILDTEKPAMMFIDHGGGADLVDRLHELGYEDNVKAVHFGSTPLDMGRYKNKRAEMWGLMNEWLCDENMPPSIPDDDQLHADLCASPYSRDSNDRILLWPKVKIIKEYGFSTDDGDALALTFAEPVSTRQEQKITFTDWNG